MDAEEYGAWCQRVPADERVARVDTPEMSDLCDALAEAGAEWWIIDD